MAFQSREDYERWKTGPRTDFDAVALKARAMLSAMGKATDYDYAILETDLPKSGLWFIEECRRRMG